MEEKKFFFLILTSVENFIKTAVYQLNPKTVESHYDCNNVGSFFKNIFGAKGMQSSALAASSIGVMRQAASVACISSICMQLSGTFHATQWGSVQLGA